MNRFIRFLLILLIAASSIEAATLRNRHLLVDVHDETGRIFISTLEGRDDIEGDERLNLLFYDNPPSSYTVINVNKDLFLFGDQTGSFTTRPLTIDESIDTVWENDLVRVQQRVSFIKRRETGIEDGLLVSYSIENKTAFNQKVGLRILFDTSLGEKGSDHFELPEGKTLQHESEFKKNNLPLYWLSQDKTNNVGVCLRGVVNEEAVSVPDRIIFANYRALRENLWHYRVKKRNGFNYPPFSRGDSVVALYYDPEDLDPGKAKEYRTILGLCGTGEYAEETMIAEPQQELTPESEKESVQIVLPSHEVDIEKLLQELKRIADMRASLEKINSLIEQLNTILKNEDIVLDEEELTELKNALDELIELRERRE